jgi:chemotaxis protein MotA
MFVGANMDMVQVGGFYDTASVFLVFGGTISATIYAHPLKQFLTGLKAAKFAFKPPQLDPMMAITQIIQLSNLARKEGLLALEETARSTGDAFLLKGVMLIADGADAELVHNVLETEIAYIENRHKNARAVFDYMANAAPSWGMMGTLIGLILMLQNLEDASAVGPSMAVAMITTFYGGIVANVVALPLISKLKIYSAEEMLIKELQVEGMLSILNGENPRNIEEKLKAFIPPVSRNASAAAEGGAPAAE